MVRSTSRRNANLNTLLNFRFQKEFAAGRGGHGEGSNRTGRKGADIELAVPVGTVIYEKQGDDAGAGRRPDRPTASGS